MSTLSNARWAKEEKIMKDGGTESLWIRSQLANWKYALRDGGGWKIRGQIGGSRGNDTGVGCTLCKAGQRKREVAALSFITVLIYSQPWRSAIHYPRLSMRILHYLNSSQRSERQQAQWHTYCMHFHFSPPRCLSLFTSVVLPNKLSSKVSCRSRNPSLSAHSLSRSLMAVNQWLWLHSYPLSPSLSLIASILYVSLHLSWAQNALSFQISFKPCSLSIFLVICSNKPLSFILCAPSEPSCLISSDTTSAEHSFF